MAYSQPQQGLHKAVLQQQLMTHSPLNPVREDEPNVQQQTRVNDRDALILQNGHVAGNKKHLPHVAIPPELALLGGAGYLATLNPALAALLTAKIDTQFFWDFTILDFAGMGFPRVSRSLQRGAIPYDPDDDPEAQKKQGLDKWAYVKQRQLQNANWPNLIEEMLREVQASPGALLVPAIIFSIAPFMGRFTQLGPLAPTGRRGLLMSQGDATQQVDSIRKTLASLQTSATSVPTSKKDHAAIATIGQQNVLQQFKGIPEKDLNSPLRIAFIRTSPGDPYYHLSKGHIETLKKTLSKNEFFGLSEQLQRLTKGEKGSTITLENVTLKKVIDELATIQGDLLSFDLEKGMDSIFTNAKNRDILNALTAKHQALYLIFEQLTEEVNARHYPKKRFDNSMTMLTKNGTDVEVLSFVKNLDRGRDILAAGMRNYFKEGGEYSPVDMVTRSFENMKATKATLALGAGVWMSSWMWYLSHAIQKGREYPANRLSRESDLNGSVLPPSPTGKQMEVSA